MTPAQQIASNPASSVWVAASAGTGKTKVLTDRVLRLLLDGASPERILCLTFTKAAAAEMKNRVVDRLAKWTRMDEADLATELQALTGSMPTETVLVSARRLFTYVLDAPGGIKIQTIHSFCQSLLRRFPVEASISPNFVLMDDRAAQDLLLAARERVLNAARLATDGRAAAALSLITVYCQDEDFADLLGELAGERVRIAALLKRFGSLGGILAELRRVLGVAESENEETVIQAACAETAFNRNRLQAVATAMQASGVTDRKNGDRIQVWLDSADRTAMFESYQEAFLTKEGESRKKLCHADTLKLLPSAADVLADEAARLLIVRLQLRAVRVYQATSSLLELGVSVLEEYARAKAARAVLDYDDLVVRTRALLTSADARSWVLFKLDGGIDHVLVDEAQDTNPEQWDVIAALVEEFLSGSESRSGSPRTVFGVGDSKQSIYGFQRAEAEGFERQRAAFSAQCQTSGMPWGNVSLDVSFRSVAAVLDTVDAVFALPEAREGVGPETTPVQHLAHRIGQGGLVELWPLATNDDPSDAESWALPVGYQHHDVPEVRLAKVIAGQIRHWLESGEILASKGRPIKAGDVLVLVRRRTRFVDALVRALKELHIPVAGADRMILTDHIAVMDMLALGRFLLLPNDDLNLASLLKSPLFGFSEEDLFALCQGRSTTVWSSLTARRDEKPLFLAAHEELTALLHEADALPPFELFASILGARGGRRKFLARLGPDAIEPLEEFLNLALSYDLVNAPSLQGFIQWVDAGQAEIKRDPDHAGQNEVRIMTVHGAKGLQAPIVFMPDTAQIPTQSSRVLWPAYDGVPIWSPRRDTDEMIAKAARSLVAHEQGKEYRRLLYVAMTRAEDRLYICGWENGRATSDDSWYSLALRGLEAAAVASRINIDLTRFASSGWTGDGFLVECAQTVSVAPVAPTSVASSVFSLPSFAKLPAPVECIPSSPLTPSKITAPDGPVRSPFDPVDPEGFRRGRLIHKLLEVLPDIERSKRLEASLRFLQNPAHGLDEKAVIELTEETLRVIDDPTFEALFGPNSQAEVPIVGVVGSEAVSGQVDRLVIDDGRVLIVDFKSNRPPPNSADMVQVAYLYQMALYRDVLRQIYPDHRIECALLWTYGRPRMMLLDSHVLDCHRPWAA